MGKMRRWLRGAIDGGGVWEEIMVRGRRFYRIRGKGNILIGVVTKSPIAPTSAGYTRRGVDDHNGGCW